MTTYLEEDSNENTYSPELFDGEWLGNSCALSLPFHLHTYFCSRYWVAVKIGIKFRPPKFRPYLDRVWTRVSPILVLIIDSLDLCTYRGISVRMVPQKLSMAAMAAIASEVIAAGNNDGNNSGGDDDGKDNEYTTIN
jgi:hypothetical protein